MGQALVNYMQKNGVSDKPLVPAPVVEEVPEIAEETVEEEEEEEEEANEVEDLKKALADKDAEIAELKAQLETKAKTTEDLAILNAVKMAGGTDWLAKACSTYKVEGRKVSGVSAKKAAEVVTENAMEKELRERRSKNVENKN